MFAPWRTPPKFIKSIASKVETKKTSANTKAETTLDRRIQSAKSAEHAKQSQNLRCTFCKARLSPFFHISPKHFML